MSTTVLTAIFLRLLAIFPSGEKLIVPEMQCIVHAVKYLRLRGTKQNYKTKQINKLQSSLHSKWTFNSVYQNYVGSENGKDFDSKSSGCSAKPPQWHAHFFVTTGQTHRRMQTKCKFCLMYCSAAMYCRHAKEKEKEKEKKQMKLTFRNNKSPCCSLQERCQEVQYNYLHTMK